MKFYIIIFALAALLLPVKNFSQTPGIIVRPAGSNGPAVLDPNADGYTSSSTAGFGTNDISTSEIPYKIVPPVIAEPTGDLLRGPSGRFSDIVKLFDGSGFYIFNDGTNLLCRLRIGGIVSGSKGYSILLDTDGKFGNSGATADPNYQPATNGNNGNPGFEFEVVLETNFRIAVYNVDGSSTPVLMASYPIANNSQISIASTTDGGDPDYFYDFYVPFSSMGISAATPLRVTATTVMSPQAAIGGPKSDIYGIAGNDYMTDWTTVILTQPAFTLNDIISAGPGVSNACTAAPTLNGPIVPSAVSVTGTWTKSVNSTISTATITLYKGAASMGTTTVSSGGSWSIGVAGLANNDVITAKAQAAGESMCLSSNGVIVNACNASNSPATPILTCTSGSKGINGTNFSTGWTIHADNLTRGAAENSVTNTSGLFGANSGTSPNITWQFSGGCSTGAPLTSGSYKIYYTNNTTGCSSQPAYFCAAGNGPNSLAGPVAMPSITPPSNGIFTPATTTISGTTTAAASVMLYIDGVLSKTTTAAGGNFTFSNLTFLQGQQFYIVAELNTGTVGTSYCATKTATFNINCFTNVPVINTGSNNVLTTGAAISGTSADPAGTLIKVYTSANTLVATTPVQNNGTWSTANASTTPAAYTALTATSYYANAINGSCGTSTNSTTYSTASPTSAARCGTLPATITESAVSVSGTLSGASVANTVVTLYEDGILIGNFTTSNNSWGPIAVNTTVNNVIYTGAVLTIGVAEPSKNEVLCSASVTVSCAPPAAPAISPASITILAGQSVTYSISSPQTGILYSLRDNTDASNIGNSNFGSGSSMNLITNPFNTPGTYTVNVKATSFSGSNCQQLTPATVMVTTSLLPVSLLTFNGTYDNTKGLSSLQWRTSSEQNLESFEIEKSYTGNNFTSIAVVNAYGNSQVIRDYSYMDSSIAGTVIYYRLKMKEKDKISSRYSQTIVLHIDKAIMINQVSPNPFSSIINLTVNVNNDAVLVLTLSDVTGRKIKRVNLNAVRGINYFSLTGLSNIVKGTYFIEVKSGNNIVRQIVIKGS